MRPYTVGITAAARIAMIATETSISASVKPRLRPAFDRATVSRSEKRSTVSISCPAIAVANNHDISCLVLGEAIERAGRLCRGVHLQHCRGSVGNTGSKES